MDFHLYAAAVYTSKYMPGQMGYQRYLDDNERAQVVRIPHILESWHYVHKQSFVDEMRLNNAKIFLDSGAFSAYTLGIKLSIEDYCRYIQVNEDIIRKEDGCIMASVMDGIGDAQETFENQHRMEQLGVRPLPCFHGGEDEAYLQYYVSKYDYITIGGMVGMKTAQLQIWLDRIWSRYLLDGSGNPRIRVHGFGITATSLMERYPWQSCDSAAWVQAGGFGELIDYEWGRIMASDRSSARHDADRHITTLTPIEKAAVEKRITDKGFTVDRVMTSPYGRYIYNLSVYPEMNEVINSRRRSNAASVPLVQELF